MIYKYHFSKMFQAGEALPKEYLPVVAAMLGTGCASEKKSKKKKEVLIPISKKRTDAKTQE